MRCLGLLIIFSMCGQVCNSQVIKNAISAEAFGPGGLGSVNYECNNFGLRENRFFSFRAGVGMTGNRSITIPHGISFNIGRKKNFLETSLTASWGNTTFGYADRGTTPYFLAPGVGYRRQSDQWFFRIYLSPYVYTQPYVGAEFGGGIGLGYMFRNRER